MGIVFGRVSGGGGGGDCRVLWLRGKGPGLPIRADVPRRKTGLEGGGVWLVGADRSTAVPLQIQPVALHHRRKDDSLYLSLASSPHGPPTSSAPSIIHSLSSSLTGTVFFLSSPSLSISPTHTHKHTLYISFQDTLPLTQSPLKETHFSFACSSKSLFTLS